MNRFWSRNEKNNIKQEAGELRPFQWPPGHSWWPWPSQLPPVTLACREPAIGCTPPLLDSSHHPALLCRCQLPCLNKKGKWQRAAWNTCRKGGDNMTQWGSGHKALWCRAWHRLVTQYVVAAAPAAGLFIIMAVPYELIEWVSHGEVYLFTLCPPLPPTPPAHFLRHSLTPSFN